MVSLWFPVDTTRFTLLKLVYAAKLPYTTNANTTKIKSTPASLAYRICFPVLFFILHPSHIFSLFVRISASFSVVKPDLILIFIHHLASSSIDNSKHWFFQETVTNHILTHCCLSPCKFSDTDYILIQIYPSTKSFYIVEWKFTRSSVVYAGEKLSSLLNGVSISTFLLVSFTLR